MTNHKSGISLGIRKRGKYNHLIQLLEQKGINYNLDEIQNLSTRQMRKRIEELGGNTEQRKNCFESRGKFRDE